MASSISGQDLELPSSFGSEGTTDLEVTENAGEQAISFNQQFLDSLASAPGSDKSHRQGAEKSSSASSRSASPRSNTSEERRKLENEVALLRKTIERNEATAALEVERMKHELEMQKLHHGMAMLSKELEIEKERATRRMSPPEKPSDSSGQVPGYKAGLAFRQELRFNGSPGTFTPFVTEIIFTCGARQLSDQATLQEIVCRCDNSSPGVGARQWLENSYSNGSAGAMVLPSLTGLLADLRLKYQKGQDETAAVKGLMLPSMKERQASGADSLVIWRSKQRRTQQLQIPDLPIEYQYHCLMCLLRDEEVTTFEAALEKDDAVSRRTLFHLQAHPGDDSVGKREAHFAAKLKTLTAWLEKEGQATNGPTAGTARVAAVREVWHATETVTERDDEEATSQGDTPVDGVGSAGPPPNVVNSATLLCVEAEVARVMAIRDRATFTAARRFPFYHGSHMEGTDEQKKQKYERNKAEFEKRKQQQQCFMCTMDALGKTQCKWADCPHHGTAASPATKMKHVVPGFNGPRHAGGTA